METIENNYLKVSIDPVGAVLTSIFFKENNEEVLYQKEKDSWPFQDVVIFPLIGAGHYVYQNKDYSMKTRHSFLRNEELKVVEKSDSKIIFKLENSKESFEEYPFNFAFYITYELAKNALVVTTKVKNTGEETMYFSYGSHTGIRARSDIGSVVFDKDYQFLPLICGLIEKNNTDNINFNCVNLKKDSFKKRDTFVFKGSKEKLELFTGLDNLVVNYEFDAPYFAIWSNPNKGEFVCIEPWWGISNYVDETEDLSKREAINTLKKNEEISFSYKLIFENKISD